MSINLSSIGSAISADLGNLVKAAEAILSPDPLKSVSGAVSDVAQAVDEGEKIIATENAEHNTPAMIQNAEALREEREVSADNAAELKAEKGDEDEVRRRLS